MDPSTLIPCHPALRLSLVYPVKVAGMMVRPRMEGHVERREWGCLSFGGLGVLSALFYQVFFQIA